MARVRGRGRGMTRVRVRGRGMVRVRGRSMVSVRVRVMVRDGVRYEKSLPMSWLLPVTWTAIKKYIVTSQPTTSAAQRIPSPPSTLYNRT